MEKLCVFSSVGMMLITVTAIYRWFLQPALLKLHPSGVLQVLLAVHFFRFISPISLMPGVTLAGTSTQFTYPQVVGDVSSAILALLAVAALRSGWRYAIPLVWVTNVFGAIDLLAITLLGFRFDFAERVGGMFYVVVWFVPWLLLSHTVIFARLARLARDTEYLQKRAGVAIGSASVAR
jgi:hypothetical protein